MNRHSRTPTLDSIISGRKVRTLSEARKVIDQARSKIAKPKLIEITAKAGKVKLRDVSKETIEALLLQIGTLFGATAAKNGAKYGNLTAHAENAVDVLEMEIHSPGGSVFDGLKLYHEIVSLRARGVKVVAHINSLAASMGSVIAMAADEVTSVQNGKLMIHDVSSSAGGTAADHERSAKLCESLSNDLATIYSRKTRLPKTKVRDLMKKETWMTANEAKQLRFVDKITTEAKAEVKATAPKVETKPTADEFLAMDQKEVQRLVARCSNRKAGKLRDLVHHTFNDMSAGPDRSKFYRMFHQIIKIQ